MTNTGNMAGAEVVQLYLRFPASAGEPPNQLKGFHKVRLEPGEQVEVMFHLTKRHFSIWNPEHHGWTMVAGEFDILVGSSSRDIRLIGKMSLP